MTFSIYHMLSLFLPPWWLKLFILSNMQVTTTWPSRHFPVMEKKCHTPGPSSQCPRRGGQIGGEITLEVTTWICLPINLVTFVSPSLPSLYNLCLPDATFGLGNPAVFCVLFYAMTKPEDESLCEFTSVLPKPSLQGQKGQDRRGRMCVVTYRNHIGFNVT